VGIAAPAMAHADWYVAHSFYSSETCLQVENIGNDPMGQVPTTRTRNNVVSTVGLSTHQTMSPPHYAISGGSSH
jgi:hypothetical protein